MGARLRTGETTDSAVDPAQTTHVVPTPKRVRQSVATGCTAVGSAYSRCLPAPITQFAGFFAPSSDFFPVNLIVCTRGGYPSAIDSRPDGGVQGPSDEPVERQRGPVRREDNVGHQRSAARPAVAQTSESGECRPRTLPARVVLFV